jgi:hypothetical protein
MESTDLTKVDTPNAPTTHTLREGEATIPAAIRQTLYLVFLWCLLGIALAYGVRLWNDVPGHPSFIPFVGIAFSAILAFAVVMAFRSVSGEVDFQFGQVKFKGASGPVLFWSLCFLAVAYGMYLLGITDVAKAAAPDNYKSCSVGEIALHKCALSKPRSNDVVSQGASAPNTSAK